MDERFTIQSPSVITITIQTIKCVENKLVALLTCEEIIKFLQYTKYSNINYIFWSECEWCLRCKTMMIGILGGCQVSTMQLLMFSEQLLAHCYVFAATF